MSECLFHRYELDGLDGDNKTYSFKQLLVKCRCKACTKFLNSWYEGVYKERKEG